MSVNVMSCKAVLVEVDPICWRDRVRAAGALSGSLRVMPGDVAAASFVSAIGGLLRPVSLARVCWELQTCRVYPWPCAIENDKQDGMSWRVPSCVGDVGHGRAYKA